MSGYLAAGTFRPLVVAIANPTDLRTVLPSTLFASGMLAWAMTTSEMFAWDAASIVADDGTTVIKPADIVHPAAGRWTVLSLGGGGTFYQAIHDAANNPVVQRAVVQFTGTAVTSVADVGGVRTVVTVDSGGGGGTFDLVTSLTAAIPGAAAWTAAVPTVTAALGKTTQYEARAVIRNTAGGDSGTIIRQFAVSDVAGTRHFVGGGATPISGSDLYTEFDVVGFDMRFALVAATGVITVEVEGPAAGSAKIYIGKVAQ